VLYILSGGGYGGSAHGDGLTNGCSTIGISKSQPVEVLEQRYPILFERYALHEGSGGAGQFRGGFGITYALRLLRGTARASMVMDHGRFGPKGAMGGEDGGVNKVQVVHADGRRYVPPHLSKDQDIELAAGDVVAVSTPGGGGFGPPALRDPLLIERDLSRGYYQREDSAAKP
jgi:N-methylhydantoinase B